MAWGTSVIGSQIVRSNFSQLERCLRLALPGGLDDPPSRVGFYYLVAFSSSFGADPRVSKVGAVYRPGMLIRIPPLVGLPEDGAYRLFIDWDVAGLAWDIRGYSFS